MSWTEIFAVVFSLICIWLAMKRHVLNWPAGLIGVGAYLVLFYQVKLYADMVLQLVFIAQGIYGWYHWQQQKNEDEKISTSYLSNAQRITTVLLIVVFAACWAVLLLRFTNADNPCIDAFVATVSLAANWLMARKKIESWILWITADLIYIALFAYKELYLSSGIYIVFLILSLKGLISWSRKNAIEKDLY